MDFSLAPVTFQQIMIFLRVAEHGGFAKASSTLNMTQSAVSKSIAKLEKDIGILLFQRTTREIHLTEAGKMLYQAWKEQAQMFHNSYVKALSIQNHENHILKIGILNTARPELYFWNIQDRYMRAHLDVHIELHSGYMTDLIDELFAAHYDLIMIPDFERFTLGELGLCWKWAARANARVIMSRHHPLADHTSLKTTDILNEKFVSLQQNSRQNHRQDLIERFARYQAEPVFVTSYKNAYDIKLLFRQQTSALLVVDEFFDYPEDPSLVKIPLIDQRNGIICAWNPNYLKPAAQDFINELQPVSSNHSIYS